jgi:hypothetical protein
MFYNKLLNKEGVIMSTVKVSQLFNSDSLQLSGHSYLRRPSSYQRSMEKFIKKLQGLGSYLPGQSSINSKVSSIGLPASSSLSPCEQELTDALDLDTLSIPATVGKSARVGRAKLPSSPQGPKQAIADRRNAFSKKLSEAMAHLRGLKAQIALERGVLTAPNTLKLDTGEILYYSNELLGQGGFKKVFRAELVSATGERTPVAASKPFPQCIDISQFAIDMAKKSSTHIVSPRYIKLKCSHRAPSFVTFSPLHTPKGTHYEGLHVGDALILNRPISNNFPYSGADRQKNHFRLIHGMVTGVLKYYQELFNQAKHMGRHGDIKPSNFLFGNKTKDAHGKPYFIIKLNDCPEDPEAAILPSTRGFVLTGINRHARDLHALRVCFFKSLYAAITKPIFEDDTGSIGIHVMDKAHATPIAKAFQVIDSIIRSKPTHKGTTEEKERALQQSLVIIKNSLIAAKADPDKPIPHAHFTVVAMLVNTIAFLNRGIKRVRAATDCKTSQGLAINTLFNIKKALEKQLPGAGVTGSPMKPKRPTHLRAVVNQAKRKLASADKRKPKPGELPPSGRTQKAPVKAKKKKN